MTTSVTLATETDISNLSGTYGQLWASPVASTTLTGTLAAWVITAVDCTAGAGARTLPAANSVTAGTPVCAKKADTSGNALVVSRAGSDLIYGTGGGATSKTLSLAGEAVEFVSNGVNKWTIRASDTPSGILASTYTPQRTFMRYDPSTKSDGAIGSAADTGQAVTSFVQTSGNPAALSISSGVITHTPPGSGVNSAGYLQCNLNARVHRIGAMISWPLNALGVATLVVPSAAWSDGSLPNAGLHLSINGNGVWTLIRYSGGGSTTLASYTTHGRFNHLLWGTGLQPFDVWLDPDNNRCVLVWPDGTSTTVTSSFLGSDTSTYAVWELFENSGTDVAASFGAVWADSQPVTPDASALTPYRLGMTRANNAPGSASVSGSVTVDLSTTPIQVLTLTGNVTAFSFSNPQSQRQEIEIHFLQDGTGSRTLAGVSGSIKWAGGSAPTLTTTISRRDIFRFRYVSGTYYEVCRSMNVG